MFSCRDEGRRHAPLFHSSCGPSTCCTRSSSASPTAHAARPNECQMWSNNGLGAGFSQHFCETRMGGVRLWLTFVIDAAVGRGGSGRLNLISHTLTPDTAASVDSASIGEPLAASSVRLVHARHRLPWLTERSAAGQVLPPSCAQRNP